MKSYVEIELFNRIHSVNFFFHMFFFSENQMFLSIASASNKIFPSFSLRFHFRVFRNASAHFTIFLNFFVMICSFHVE